MMAEERFIQSLGDGVDFEMIRIEGGSFRMGGADEEAFSSEKPVHGVSVPTFYIGKFQVTQSLWQAVMGNNPSGFKGENRPVEQISWLKIVKEFLPKLNKITSKNYRLSTESEWEFAARGGKKSAGYIYSGSDKLKQVGWYDANSSHETHPVGQKMANELGLHDMSGNVWEWCADHYHDRYNNAPDDGTTWLSDEEGAPRVVRGGSCFDESRLCRAACRDSYRPGGSSGYIGFRLALSPQ